MEHLRDVKELLEPDDRTKFFENLKTGQHISLEEQHAEAAGFTLNSTVPEEVRSYFATIQNLYLYSWFCYDFYPIVHFLSCAVVELALRIRFSVDGIDRRGLKKLLRIAIKEKAIHQKRFSRVRWRRKVFADGLRDEREWARRAGKKVIHKRYDFLKALEDYLPNLRNSYAHPEYHTILPLGYAYDALLFASEFINQLFPEIEN